MDRLRDAVPILLRPRRVIALSDPPLEPLGRALHRTIHRGLAHPDPEGRQHQGHRPITQHQHIQHHPDPFGPLIELHDQHALRIDPEGAMTTHTLIPAGDYLLVLHIPHIFLHFLM